MSIINGQKFFNILNSIAPIRILLHKSGDNISGNFKTKDPIFLLILFELYLELFCWYPFSFIYQKLKFYKIDPLRKQFKMVADVFSMTLIFHNMIFIVNLQLNFSNFNFPAVRSFVDLSKFLAYQFHTKEKVIWMWF